MSESKRLESLEAASAQVLTCRDEGHIWSHVDDVVTTGLRGSVIEFTQVRRCHGCMTVRRRTIAVPSFAIVKTNYNYDEGYLLKRDLRLTRNDVRREVFNRLTKD